MTQTAYPGAVTSTITFGDRVNGFLAVPEKGTGPFGAVILGLAETYGLAYAPTYSVVFTFVILILVLAFRPRGIMGKAA